MCDRQCQNACVGMFLAVLFTTAKAWKEPRCPAMGQWIKELLYNRTIEYYAAFLTNQVLQHQQLAKSHKYNMKLKILSANRLSLACYLLKNEGKNK